MYLMYFSVYLFVVMVELGFFGLSKVTKPSKLQDKFRSNSKKRISAVTNQTSSHLSASLNHRKLTEEFYFKIKSIKKSTKI